MFDNIALDVFIGLIAIYLLYSLLASILMESLAKRLDLRARMTQKAISKLLDDSDITDDDIFTRGMKSISETQFTNSFKGRPLTALFYAHPTIKNLGKNTLNRKPSDIPPELFSETLIQILRGDVFAGPQNQIDLITTNLKLNEPKPQGTILLPDWYTDVANKTRLWEKEIKNQDLTSTTLTINHLTLYQFKQFLYDSHSDINVFKERLIIWYNQMMDRATGWYIKQTRILLFIIGFFLALGFNVDTIAISAKLAKDKIARDKMIEFAGKLQTNTASNNSSLKNDPTAEKATNKALEQAYNNITQANQIIGNSLSSDVNGYSFLGWLITAFAISLGAPFWFDLLKKIMSVRQAGNNSAEESVNNKSKGKNIVSPKDRIG